MTIATLFLFLCKNVLLNIWGDCRSKCLSSSPDSHPEGNLSCEFWSLVRCVLNALLSSSFPFSLQHENIVLDVLNESRLRRHHHQDPFTPTFGRNNHDLIPDVCSERGRDREIETGRWKKWLSIFFIPCITNGIEEREDVCDQSISFLQNQSSLCLRE